MRVVIDTSYTRRGRSGTGIYLEELIRALRERGEVELVEAGQRVRPRPGRFGARRNPLRSALNGVLDAGWLHAGLPRAARRAGAEVVHHPMPISSPLIRATQVATVHDLAFERFPAGYGALWRALARRRARAAARRCAALVCVSEATAADAAELLGVPRERLLVARHGPGQTLPERERAAAPSHFLYVGDREPRKGLPRLLDAYAGYRRRVDRPLGLVLAGAAAREAGGDGVRGEPSPDPAALAELHARAAALVHPALHEGFGMTLAEAMAAGTPVVAVANPAVEEVCAGACLIVDSEGLEDAMERVAGDPAVRERLSLEGRRRAAELSWEESARAHERVYTLAVD